MKTLKIGLVLAGITVWLVFGYATSKVGHVFYDYFSDTESETILTPAEESCNSNSIQVALLLDTSGSMSGLISQAKSQLWNILNELARTEKNGDDINLEIALYEYGNPSKSKFANQVNRLTEFTTDMDLISEKLFALNTSGGDEYCGTVIQESLNDLNWNNDNSLKVIYIAGNEPFTQGMISFETACKNAVKKGVAINTIYCGKYTTGIKDQWKAGAHAGGGDYLNIDHNQETVYIDTPFDDELNDLNTKLNKTYIPYGAKGADKSYNQSLQDLNASSISKSNNANRAAFKSSRAYKNADWDLVDAYNANSNIVQEVEVVVDSLQDITAAKLEATILKVSKERKDIQSAIQDLNKKRNKYQAENASNNSDESLQRKMINSIQKQAKQKGFKIKE